MLELPTLFEGMSGGSVSFINSAYMMGGGKVMRKYWAWILIFGLAIGLGGTPPAKAQDANAALDVLTRKTDDLGRKMSELLKGQQDLSNQLKEIKAELAIIKVRATQ
jgi:hypothetical protein